MLRDISECMSKWDRRVFLDDQYSKDELVLDAPVIGKVSDAARVVSSNDDWIVAIGDVRKRLDLITSLRTRLGAPAVLVHPDATVSRFARLGAGTVVMAGAVINVDSVIGDGCIINTGASVDHDCILGDGVHICPGTHLGGSVKVGEGSWIGIGSAVRHGVRIGRYVTVGAGAAVVSDLPDGVTVVGVPAKPLCMKA